MKLESGAEVIDEKHTDYDETRKLFNGFHDIRPKYLVKCQCEEDVRSAIFFAKAENLKIAVKAGGHSVAGLSLVEQGVVIDISALNQVFVDTASNKVIVEGGATLRDLDLATSFHGMATTGGIISNTGVGGLTLGGGLGWLMGAHGLACDNLLGADVVLASGKKIRVDANNNSSLFLGLKGGCFNFGVVLSFEFSLMVLSKVFAGTLRYDFDSLAILVDKFLDAEKKLSTSAGVDLVIATDPKGQKSVFLDLCCPVGLTDLQQDMDIIEQAFEGSSKFLHVRNYVDWQTEFDDILRSGRRAYWKSLSVPKVTGEMITALHRAFDNVPSEYTQISIDCIRGVARSEKNGPTLFGDRSNRFVILINSAWVEKYKDQENIRWTRELFRQLVSVAPRKGVYGNYLDLDDNSQKNVGDQKISSLFMKDLRKQYDPQQWFNDHRTNTE